MAVKGEDRRRHARVARALAIQFRLKKGRKSSDDEDAWHLSLTIDMSASGIAFESSIPYTVGDILELHVVMSGILDVVKGEGRVVRIEEKAPGRLYFVAVELKKHL